MRNLLLVTLFALAACASDPDEAACDQIADGAARQACLRDLIAREQAQRDNNGHGPPSCHPASTNPDLDRDPC